MKSDLLRVILEQGPEEHTVRYILKNNHSFPVAVLRWQIPSERGGLPDSIFTFSPNSATFVGIVGFREWQGMDSVLVINPGGQHEVEIDLREWYAGLDQVASVRCDYYLQAGRFRSVDRLHLDSLELVRVTSNVVDLR